MHGSMCLLQETPLNALPTLLLVALFSSIAAFISSGHYLHEYSYPDSDNLLNVTFLVSCNPVCIALAAIEAGQSQWECY